MGKNLKGRECGKGICQRKDGKYSARYIAKDGSRREKHFADALQGGLEPHGSKICRFYYQTDLHRNGNYVPGSCKQ